MKQIQGQLISNLQMIMHNLWAYKFTVLAHFVCESVSNLRWTMEMDDHPAALGLLLLFLPFGYTTYYTVYWTHWLIDDGCAFASVNKQQRSGIQCGPGLHSNWVIVVCEGEYLEWTQKDVSLSNKSNKWHLKWLNKMIPGRPVIPSIDDDRHESWWSSGDRIGSGTHYVVTL